MDMIAPYQGTRDELLSEIAEVRAVVYADQPLHGDPLEDMVIRGIWGALLDPLIKQLEAMERFEVAKTVQK